MSVRDMTRIVSGIEALIMWEVATRGIVRGVVVGVVAGPVLLVPFMILYVQFAPGFWPSTFDVAMRAIFFGIIIGGVLGAPVGVVAMVAWRLFKRSGRSCPRTEDDIHA